MRLKAIFMSALCLLMGLGLFSIPAHAATAPTIANSTAGSNISSTLIPLTLAPSSGDSLVVFEWIGPVFSGVSCPLLLPPVDSSSNSWSSLGGCITDGNAGQLEVFITNSTATGTDTINCNFGSNTVIDSCYAIDVASPGSASLLASNTGTGTPIRIGSGTSMFTGAPNSLLLGMAGIQFYCQTVGLGGIGFVNYIPPSSCTSVGSFSYGLSGKYFSVGSGGLTTFFPMTTGQGGITWSEMVVQIAAPSVITTTTVNTATVTGWLAPDATHLSNTLVLFIFPLAGMIFMFIPIMMFQKNQEIGDKAIYPALFGLTVGSAAADLLTGSAASAFIPFADVFVCVLLLFLWWWNS